MEDMPFSLVQLKAWKRLTQMISVSTTEPPNTALEALALIGVDALNTILDVVIAEKEKRGGPQT